jgi:phosphoribosylformylglycinamidine synthase
VSAVHDLSDGGLAVALAEMAMASGIGATTTAIAGGNAAATFFGEDQGRYLLTAPQDRLGDLQARAAAAGVPLAAIGATGGSNLKLGDFRAISLDELRRAHENWFPAFMDGGRK